MNLKLAQFLTKATGAISPRLQYSLAYFHNRGRFPNLKNPKNLSEIIGKQMLSGEINQFAKYADKVEVRKYIEEWGLGKYLPKLYGVWDKFDDIDFDELPSSFALKTNHGAGGNYICFDKNKMDKAKAKEIINKSLSKVYGGKTETHYSLIKPKVFAEELLSDNGELPIDYKFHCSNGKVRGVLLVLERGKEQSHRLFYNTNWQNVDIIRQREANYDIEKPAKFEKMIEVAQFICEKFRQVRVDLYYINNKVYIGELTFTPNGGLLYSFSLDGLYYLAGAKNIS